MEGRSPAAAMAGRRSCYQRRRRRRSHWPMGVGDGEGRSGSFFLARLDQFPIIPRGKALY
jgi:hypothetical protein